MPSSVTMRTIGLSPRTTHRRAVIFMLSSFAMLGASAAIMGVSRRGRASESRLADGRPETMSDQPAPDRILQLGMGFWGAKTLLSAVELGLFTELAKGSLDAEALRERLG